MNQPEKKNVTLEDLLRLKRAERPAPEFWAKFESDMRAKQLSAIVARPRWSGVSTFFGLLTRYQLPIGAAAAVSIAYLGYTQVSSAPRAQAVSAPVVISRALKPAPVSYYLPVGKPAMVAAQATARVSETVAAAVPAAVVAATSSHLVPVSVAPAAPAAHSPFADGVAVTFADYREAPPSIRPSTFGSDSEFEVVSARTTAAVDPLSRLDPTEERRSRMLDSSLPSQRTMASDWMRTRASSDDRMAESLEHSSDHLLTGIRF